MSLAAAATQQVYLASGQGSGLFYVGSIVISIVVAFICANVAGGKGYSSILFGILGFFFSIITLIVVLVLPRKSRL